MTWKAFLILLNMNAKQFCQSLIIPDKGCHQAIVECVLDGESFEWCTNNYDELLIRIRK